MNMAAAGLSGVEDFHRRVLAAQWPSQPMIDDRLGRMRDSGSVELELRNAAVLIAVVERAGEACMIMTQRTRNLRSHSGQVAFPGGRIDAEDESAVAAALRETHEEIGVEREAFEVIGQMPDYATATGYLIAPVLALASPGIRYRINPDEVEAAFEVPLRFLMDPRNHRQESAVWQGLEHQYWTMPYGNRYIWGVTARLIREIYERLYA